MKEIGSFFGITDQEDPHMMRNMEWGAVTYLTQSNYGKQGNPSYRGDEKTVVNNNNSSYMTGCGANTLDDPLADTCSTYETSQGQAASTTGNITGVYDTSGSAWDFVATAMRDSNGTDIVLANGGFELANITAIVKEGKYMVDKKIEILSFFVGRSIIQNRSCPKNDHSCPNDYRLPPHR